MARIFVTGFSCFGQVICNPTEEIIQELTNCVENRQVDNNTQATIIGTKCLDVSALSVKEWIKQELYPYLDKLENTANMPTVVVHLGVDEKSQNIRIESGAYNEAKFRIPDQSGWQPDGIAIDSKEECTYFKKTRLPVKKLAESLSKFIVHISHDAGRYVCNYSYYISLQEAEAANRMGKMFSLFVHVPPFSKVPKEMQLECLYVLFENLATCLVEGWEDEEEKAAVEEEEEKEGSEKSGGKMNEPNRGNESLRKRCSIM